MSRHGTDLILLLTPKAGSSGPVPVAPAAAFIAQNPQIQNISGMPVNAMLTDESTGNPTSWNWSARNPQSPGDNTWHPLDIGATQKNPVGYAGSALGPVAGAFDTAIGLAGGGGFNGATLDIMLVASNAVGSSTAVQLACILIGNGGNSP